MHSSRYAGNDVDSLSDTGHHPVVYATAALIARKLGVAEQLERSELRFRAALRTRVVGHAVYDNVGPGTSEPIDMLNVVVTLTGGHNSLPPATASYSHILWTPVARFLDALQTRNPAAIDPLLDPLELCLHGLCLSAAEHSIASLLDANLPRQPRVASSRVT